MGRCYNSCVAGAAWSAADLLGIVVKKPFSSLLLCVASVVVCLIVLEAGLALFWPHKLKARPYHEKYDPTMGWVNKPDKDEEVRLSGDIYFRVKQNSLGLRGPEIQYSKPPGVTRVLLLGDSFFWGYGVSNEEVLSAVMQQEVPASVEIVNGAVTGYGTDQELLWLRNEGLKFQPDVVVLGFFPTNDLDEISSSVAYYYPKPVFLLEDGRPVLKNVPVPKTEGLERKVFANPPTLFGKIKKFLRYHTHTYPFIVGRLNSNPELRLLFLNLGLAEEYTTEMPGVPVIANKPEDVSDLLTQLLLEVRRTADGAGSRFLLVYIPQKEDDPSGGVTYRGINKGARAKNTQESGAVRRLASATGMECLDLLPVIREHQGKGEILYYPGAGDHHWTPAGHRVAAEAIVKRLRENRWIE